MSVTFSPPTEQYIRDAVTTGEFESRERLLEDAVELMRMRREYVRSLLQEGIDQLDRGEGLPAAEVFARLKNLAAGNS